MDLVSSQLLTEMSTRNLPGGKAAGAKADLTADCVENMGASTSHNPVGLHSLLEG
jgi:hypothetical protein